MLELLVHGADDKTTLTFRRQRRKSNQHPESLRVTRKRNIQISTKIESSRLDLGTVQGLPCEVVILIILRGTGRRKKNLEELVIPLRDNFGCNPVSVMPGTRSMA